MPIIDKLLLSDKQMELLRKATEEWEPLPIGIGCTNATLESLERRGLVETSLRSEVNSIYPVAKRSIWVWRKAQK